MLANFKKAHMKESGSPTPTANRKQPSSHNVQIKMLLDSGWLTVPASNSRLSELELMSWEKEEGLRFKSGGVVEGVRARQNKTKKNKQNKAHSYV